MMTDFNKICQKYINDDIATMSDEDADELMQNVFFDSLVVMHMENETNLDEDAATGTEPKEFSAMLMKAISTNARMDSEWMA